MTSLALIGLTPPDGLLVHRDEVGLPHGFIDP
jgi:hypothetical protein